MTAWKHRDITYEKPLFIPIIYKLCNQQLRQCTQSNSITSVHQCACHVIIFGKWCCCCVLHMYCLVLCKAQTTHTHTQCLSAVVWTRTKTSKPQLTTGKQFPCCWGMNCPFNAEALLIQIVTDGQVTEWRGEKKHYSQRWHIYIILTCKQQARHWRDVTVCTRCELHTHGGSPGGHLKCHFMGQNYD